MLGGGKGAPGNQGVTLTSKEVSQLQDCLRINQKYVHSQEEIERDYLRIGKTVPHELNFEPQHPVMQYLWNKKLHKFEAKMVSDLKQVSGNPDDLRKAD